MKTINFLYKWLPLVFGCHCRADRSFFYKGVKFPICARCTGELLGGLIAALTSWCFHPPAFVLGLMLVPLIIDGVIQQFSRYESNNWRRLVTGLLFGYAIVILFVISIVAVFQYGFQIGLRLKGN